MTVRLKLSGLDAGEHFYALINRLDGMNMKPAFADSLNNTLAQHQMFYIGAGDQHPLTPGQPARRTISKNPSIFSFTPPMARTCPCWLTEPATAKHC